MYSALTLNDLPFVLVWFASLKVCAHILQSPNYKNGKKINQKLWKDKEKQCLKETMFTVLQLHKVPGIQLVITIVKLCSLYLDCIVRYIVRRKATRFVSVWSMISIFCSSAKKTKQLVWWITLSCSAEISMLFHPVFNKIIILVPKYLSKWKHCLYNSNTFVFSFFIIIIIFVVAIIITWRLIWITFT